MRNYFWKKFSKYLLIGLSVMVLFSLLQKITINEVLQRGPNVVLAEGDDCTDPDSFGCPEPGGAGEEAPTPTTPVNPPAPSCTEVRQYNECISCNTSRRISQDSCGRYNTIVGSQSDSACSSWCASTPTPAPSCTEVRQYNECISCNTSRRISQDSCGRYNTIVGSQSDSACSSWCASAPAAPAPAAPAPAAPAAPACTPNGSCSASSPSCGTTTTGVDNCGNSCSRQGSSCPVTAPTQSTVSACGKTGVLAPGYTLYTPASCSSSQYLYVNVEGGYLTNACLSVPSGNAKTADGCSYAPISTPSACVSNGSCNASVPACGTTTRGVDNCGNSCTKQGGACACVSNGSCSAPAPSCGSVTVGVDNCGATCSKQGVACTIAQGAPVITNTFNPVNTNTNTNSNTNTITNNVTREVVREVAVAPATFGNVGVGREVIAPVVQYTALPKTGLPAIAWSALAFIPAGFSLRRFSKIKKALENHPSFIWEDRQFKSEV